MDNHYHPFGAGMEKLASEIESMLQVYTWISAALVVVILLAVICLFISEVKAGVGNHWSVTSKNAGPDCSYSTPSLTTDH